VTITGAIHVQNSTAVLLVLISLRLSYGVVGTEEQKDGSGGSVGITVAIFAEEFCFIQ
jgi:hypothetical protein